MSIPIALIQFWILLSTIISFCRVGKAAVRYLPMQAFAICIFCSMYCISCKAMGMDSIVNSVIPHIVFGYIFMIIESIFSCERQYLSLFLTQASAKEVVERIKRENVREK